MPYEAAAPPDDLIGLVMPDLFFLMGLIRRLLKIVLGKL